MLPVAVGFILLGILLACTALVMLRSISFDPLIPSTGGEPMPRGFEATNPLELYPIGGRVWHDLCAATAGGQAPTVLPAGCVETQAGIRANGIREAGEPGISGVLVRLGSGECPSIDLSHTITDENGDYQFLISQPGTYCISIDSTSPDHIAALVPGLWTKPDNQGNESTAEWTVEVREIGTQDAVSFGWDHQFLPVLSPTTTVPPTQTSDNNPLACHAAAFSLMCASTTIAPG
jgi:hypothetical protein